MPSGRPGIRCNSYKSTYEELTPLLNNFLYELRILKEIVQFEIKINKEDLLIKLVVNLNNETLSYDLNVGINQYKKDLRFNKINKIELEKEC